MKLVRRSVVIAGIRRGIDLKNVTLFKTEFDIGQLLEAMDEKSRCNQKHERKCDLSHNQQPSRINTFSETGAATASSSRC